MKGFLVFFIVSLINLTLHSEEVLILFNSNVPTGKELALDYVKLYELTSDSILGIDVPTKETISKEEYLTCFRSQLEKRFEERRPSVILTVYGIPLWVEEKSRLRSFDQLLVLGEGVEGLDERLILNPLLQSPIPPFASQLVMVSRLDGPSIKQAKLMFSQWKEHKNIGCWRRFAVSGNDKDLEQLILQKGLWLEKSPALNVLALSELQFLHTHQGRLKELREMHRNELLAPGAMMFRYHSTSFRDGDFRSMGSGDASAACLMGTSFFIGAQKTERPEEDLFDPMLFFLKYSQGQKFIEAVYNAMPNLGGSMLILGDPLAKPFSESSLAFQKEYFEKEQLEDPSELELTLYNQAKDWWLIRDYFKLWGKGYAKMVIASLKMAIQNRKSSVFYEHLVRSYKQIGKKSEMDYVIAKWPESKRSDWDKSFLELMGY